MSTENSSKNNSNMTQITTTSFSISTSPAVSTKMCHIVKRPDFEGYGFNLHSEKIKPGQYIGKVDSNSPAEVAGLKEGDRIIEVNGVEIGNETHKQVVQRIKAIACEVRLLLINVESNTLPNEENGNNETKYSEELSCDKKRETSEFSDNTQSSKPNAKTVESTNIDMVDHELNDANNDKLIITTLSSATSPSNSYNSNNNNKQINNMKTGRGSDSINSLQLPVTAAEMRAKLLMKKKFDPKNESVDLKKKFEIIQKL